MKSYFITATGTGIGKTLFTSALAYQLRQAGRGVRAIKPVISGFDESDAGASDTGVLLTAQGLPLSQSHMDAVSPWRFAAPLSPDMAAGDEGRTIDMEPLAAFCRRQGNAEYLLVEAVGGIMTPLNVRYTVLDWAAALQFSVVLLAGSYLGSLSHTLAAAHVIRSSGLPLYAVVVSESEHSPVPLARTQETLRRFLPSATKLCSIARLDSSAALWKDVPCSLHGVFL